MGDKTKGIYNKFIVERTDGSHLSGGKHHGCNYFVLDLNHDKFAAPALKAYAEACKYKYPLLAKDLMNMADGIMFWQEDPLARSLRDSVTDETQEVG